MARQSSVFVSDLEIRIWPRIKHGLPHNLQRDKTSFENKILCIAPSEVVKEIIGSLAPRLIDQGAIGTSVRLRVCSSGLSVFDFRFSVSGSGFKS